MAIEQTQEEMVVVEATPAALSLIVARSDLVRFQASLLAEARQRIILVENDLTLARDKLVALEASDDPKRAADMAEHVGLPDQANEHRWHRTDQIGGARRRITQLTKRYDVARRLLEALEAGHVPIPRLPAVKLEYAIGLIPLEALESLDMAQNTGLFDEFRIIDGRAANRYGYPQTRTRPKGRDPILVGMIGNELFPLAWWR